VIQRSSISGYPENRRNRLIYGFIDSCPKCRRWYVKDKSKRKGIGYLLPWLGMEVGRKI
jgi:hypothetical protein